MSEEPSMTDQNEKFLTPKKNMGCKEAQICLTLSNGKLAPSRESSSQINSGSTNESVFTPLSFTER